MLGIASDSHAAVSALPPVVSLVCARHNDLVRGVQFTTSARKHHIGKGRALWAMEDAGEPDVIPGQDGLGERLLFIGHDERGDQLEVIVIAESDHLLVIHVMPYA